VRHFFLQTEPGEAPRAGDVVVLDAEESHHALGVLRRAGGQELALVDGRGHHLTARLSGREGRRARLEVLTVVRDDAEAAAPRLRLACGVVKGRRWEWVLEKAVELGVHRLTPLITKNGVVEPGAGRRERWLTVLRAALKQAGRCWLPDLDEPLAVDPFAAGAAADGEALWFGAVPGEHPEEAPARPVPATSAWLTVAIGPEGGWTELERTTLLGAGARPLDLGPHVLRTETAAAAALVLLQRERRRLQAGAGS